MPAGGLVAVRGQPLDLSTINLQPVHDYQRTPSAIVEILDGSMRALLLKMLFSGLEAKRKCENAKMNKSGRLNHVGIEQDKDSDVD